MEQRSRTLFLLLASTLIVALGGGPAGWAQTPDPLPTQETAAADTAEKGAPYVPTPPHVVWRMLELADVSEDDVVYDLGSGDGRIVLAAADRVTFRQEDLFEADLSDATVVMLYLWPDMNNRLRPKLKRVLDPGDRVVSHSFDIDGWAADTTVSLGTKMGGSPRTLFRWTIPDTTDAPE